MATFKSETEIVEDWKNKKMKISKKEIGINLSIDFGADVHLHLNMCEVLFGYFARQEGHHHVKAPEISVKFACRLDQSFPVCQTFVHIVLS